MFSDDRYALARVQPVLEDTQIAKRAVSRNHDPFCKKQRLCSPHQRSRDGKPKLCLRRRSVILIAKVDERHPLAPEGGLKITPPAEGHHPHQNAATGLKSAVDMLEPVHVHRRTPAKSMQSQKSRPTILYLNSVVLPSEPERFFLVCYRIERSAHSSSQEDGLGRPERQEGTSTLVDDPFIAPARKHIRKNGAAACRIELPQRPHSMRPENARSCLARRRRLPLWPSRCGPAIFISPNIICRTLGTRYPIYVSGDHGHCGSSIDGWTARLELKLIY